MAAKPVGECCLRWTDHNTLLQGVCTSLLTTEKFADVTLYCEGMSLKCHKFILSACSPYFDKILSETPCEHPVVILRDVQYWQMQALLQFIYKGELTTDETKLSSLVELAQNLHIKGIGEFGCGESSEESPIETTCSQNKRKPDANEETACQEKGMKDYLSLDGNISTLSEGLMNLPPESQQILRETLTASIEASDYTLQETEVEYSFQAGSLDDSQHIDQPILVEYTNGDGTSPCRKKKRLAESEASSSDASMSALTAVPVYKKYTEENLLAAIKAVVDEGIKQTDASAKFGVPFTTLTRKIHLYQEYGGRLPRYSTKRKERPPRAVSLAGVLSIDNELDGAISNDSAVLEGDGRVVVMVNEADATPTAPKAHQPAVKQYKTYTEDNLKAAISDVLHKGVRLQDASQLYKIPLTTLTRKIRSSSNTAAPSGGAHRVST